MPIYFAEIANDSMSVDGRQVVVDEMSLVRVESGDVPVIYNHDDDFDKVVGKVLAVDVSGGKMYASLFVGDPYASKAIDERMADDIGVGLSVGLGVRFIDVDMTDELDFIFERSTLTEVSLVATPALTGAKIISKMSDEGGEVDEVA